MIFRCFSQVRRRTVARSLVWEETSYEPLEACRAGADRKRSARVAGISGHQQAVRGKIVSAAVVCRAAHEEPRAIQSAARMAANDRFALSLLRARDARAHSLR